ncbi:MAG TPA: biotin/lipoyl-containing protein [Kofleriaceae bacterium]|nr:biotin/lipoyl-containing protein [Kofleriaceae bacterium]
MRRAGRLHAPELAVLVSPPRPGAGIERSTIELRAPGPGMFVPWVAQGDLITAGSDLGELVVLGRASVLVVPRSGQAAGIALRLPPAVRAVGHGDVLVELDPSLQRAAGAAPTAASPTADAALGLVFHAPTSGRFYGRPGPDKPAFVAEGTVLTAGTTVCLLEVMKTFHRVTYGGPGLPDTARVRRVLVADGADVNAGDPLLALE